MGNKIKKGLTATQFYLHGKKNFTRTGWENASKNYVPGELENADMKGRVVMITGANSGIGFSCAEFLATRGAKIYMVCRNKERGEDARQQIIDSSKNPEIHLLIGDVSMKQEVKKIAEDFMAQEKELNVLILNAGALSYKKEVNAEGLETTIAAQLIYGAYYLTKLLIPVLKNDSRVIAVSSGGMYNVAFPDWQQAISQKENIVFDGQLAYAYAKRGQVILMEELSKMYNDIKFVSCHPGWVDTPGVESAYGSKKKYLEPLRTLWQGAEGICWLAVVPSERLVPGAFYLDRKPQQKHITGTFNSDGSYTRNTSDQVLLMMKRLEEYTQ